jgi:hypothetical protein
MQVLKDEKRVTSGMRLLRLSTSVSSRSRRGGRRQVSGRLLCVALLMNVRVL